LLAEHLSHDSEVLGWNPAGTVREKIVKKGFYKEARKKFLKQGQFFT
jgi:hypothetical protein